MSEFLVNESRSFKDRVTEILREILADPLNPVLDPLRASIPGYLEINPPTLPINQITGFTKFLPNTATDAGSVSTTSGTYVSLSGGPTISDLANGYYLVLYSAVVNPTAASYAYASPSVNSATPTDENALQVATGGAVTMSSFTFATLSAGTNTIELQYKSSGGATSQFQYRRISAFKYESYP